MTADDKEALYAAAAPESTRFVGKGGAGEAFRVYFCRCNARSIGGYDLVDLTDCAWVCGGHPAE